MELHEIRQATGDTPAEFAVKLGVSQSYLSHLKRGVEAPSDDVVATHCTGVTILVLTRDDAYASFELAESHGGPPHQGNLPLHPPVGGTPTGQASPGGQRAVTDLRRELGAYLGERWLGCGRIDGKPHRASPGQRVRGGPSPGHNCLRKCWCGRALLVHTNTVEAKCGADVFLAPAGATVFMPRGLTHTFRSVGGLATILFIVTPGYLDEFFRLKDEAEAPADVARLVREFL